MVTLDEVAVVNPLPVAFRVYVPAAAVPVIWQLVKVATPATALIGLAGCKPGSARVVPPLPAVYEATDRATVPVSVVTVLPPASSTVTWAGWRSWPPRSRRRPAGW